jgi:quercetin dioxygenase-like cupin family protein
MKQAASVSAHALGLIAVGLVAIGLPANAQQAGHTAHAGHVVLHPTNMTWADVPALPGVRIAVIEGPLNEAGPIMFRLKFPPNYQVPPHRHPGIEHITVISGTLNIGMGETFDKSKTHALKPGSVAIMPPGTPHFVWTSEETIGQVHGIGPWGVAYVNPSDDPKNK